jgi:RNA:NAD 2'-phosphotransferase (TPT1/KptA family)
MLVVVRMKVSGYEDGLDEVRSRARRSRVQRNRLVEVVEEEKVGRWKGGLSSRRSEGGCGVIMQFMTPEKLTPK